MSMATRSEVSCNICFNDYNSSDRQAVALPCIHSFCITCLTRLRSSDLNKCPVCREDWGSLRLINGTVEPGKEDPSTSCGGRDNDVKPENKEPGASSGGTDNDVKPGQEDAGTSCGETDNNVKLGRKEPSANCGGKNNDIKPKNKESGASCSEMENDVKLEKKNPSANCGGKGNDEKPENKKPCASCDGKDSDEKTEKKMPIASCNDKGSDVKEEKKKSSSSCDGKSSNEKLGKKAPGTNGSGHLCDMNTPLKIEVNDLCPDHTMPYLFWCEECKEFSCKKCVTKKQKTCTLEVIEDVISNIASYFDEKIEETVFEIQNKIGTLKETRMQTAEKLSSEKERIKELQKNQGKLTTHVKQLDNLISERDHDLVAVKKYSVALKKLGEKADVPLMISCMKTLDKIRKHRVPPSSSVAKTLLPVVTPSYESVQNVQTAEYTETNRRGALKYSTRPLLDAVMPRPPPLMEKSELMLDASNWTTVVLSLAERHTKRLTVVAARDGMPECLPAEAVATVARVARDCTVETRFLDTFFNPLDPNKDRQRLELFLTNGRRTGVGLTGFYGHLDADGIARLPNSVYILGLAIGSAADAMAVSAMEVWKCELSLRVAVSIRVDPAFLKPLPNVRHLNLYFYSFGDAEVDGIRPAINALVPDKRFWSLCLPKSQLTASGVRRLSHRLRGVKINRVYIEPSGIWRPDGKEQQKISKELGQAVNYGAVQWNMSWLFGKQREVY